MKERQVNFTLLGQEFTFLSDAPDEEVEKILSIVRQEFEVESKPANAIPSNKSMVLACLRIAARLLQEQKEFANYKREQTQVINRLLERFAEEIE